MKRKIILIMLMFSLFIISSLLGFSFIKNVNAISQDIDYTFENDYIYNSNDGLDIEYFNVRNKSIYSGHYNATYSFENDIIGSNPLNFIVNEENIDDIQVISNYSNHQEVVKIIGNSENDNYIAQAFDISQEIGIIELWINHIDLGNDEISIIIYGNSIESCQIVFELNKIYIYNGSVKTLIMNIPINWIHIKFNISIDTFDVYINNILKASNFNITNNQNPNVFISIEIRIPNWNYECIDYFDAIGYSWDDNYVIGQNLMPYLEVNPNIQEIDKCEFAYNLTTLEPNALDSEIINNNWIENDDGTDSHVKTSGIHHGVSIDYLITQDQDYYGIYKEFDYGFNGIFNISFSITLMNLFNPHLDGWYFEVYSYDDTLLVSLLCNLTNPPVISLYYYNGSSYVFIHDIVDIFGSFSFNIYINHFVILRLNDDDVSYQWFLSKLTDKIGINTIKVIGGHKDDIGNSADVIIDSIGLYINGSSYLPDDLLAFVINTNIEQWDDNIHNLFEVNGIGNFSFSVYYDGSIAYKIIPYSEFNNVIKRFFLLDFDIFKGNDDYDFKFISNIPFILSEVKVYANILKEGSNIYRPSFSYANIDTNESYFYVRNNKLYFNHISNENNTLEYIQLYFNIDDIYSLNRSINFNTYFLGISKAYFINNYVSNTNSIFFLRLGYQTINMILPQQQIIKSFTILITDNNNDDYYGNSNGFISSIKLIYYPDIELTILTLSLIEIMIPLIIIIIPTVAIASVYGKKAILPMLMLMSIICFATYIIPIEIFFIIIIALGSGMFLQYKKEREKI